MHYRRRLKFFLLKFLRLNGTPHKVALGFSLGSIINFIPTFGFAIPLAAFIAGILRQNIVAAVIGDVLFKPLFPFFFYLDLRVGHLLLGKTFKHIRREMWALMHLKLTGIQMLGKTFFLGMLVNIVIVIPILYILIYTLLKFFRKPLMNVIRKTKWLDKRD